MNKNLLTFSLWTSILLSPLISEAETKAKYPLKPIKTRGVVQSVSLSFGEFVVILNDKTGGKRRKIIRGAVPITDGTKDVAMLELIPGESVTVVESPTGEVVEVFVKPAERDNKDPAFDQSIKKNQK